MVSNECILFLCVLHVLNKCIIHVSATHVLILYLLQRWFLLYLKNHHNCDSWVVILLFFIVDASKFTSKGTQYATKRNVRHTIVESKILNRQQVMERRIKDTCEHLQKMNIAHHKPLNIDHLVVDDKHKLIYCFIPKVACSSWKSVLAVTSGRSNLTYHDIENPQKEHLLLKKVHRKNYYYKTFGLRLLSNMSYKDMMYRRRTYYKFMFVRNPIERLYSGWWDKFGRHQVGFAASIPKQTKYDDYFSFEEFIQFITNYKVNNRQINDHWDSYYNICFPCYIDYDFVGSMENMEEDANYIMRKFLHSTYKFPAVNIRSKWTNRTQLFHLSAELLQAVEKAYKEDFMLFGFNTSNPL